MILSVMRLVRRRSRRWHGSVHEWWWPDETDDVDDALVAHPARVGVRHSRRWARHGYYLGAMRRANPETTPLRNLKLAGELAWLGDDEGAVEALRAELQRTAADLVEGIGPRQRIRAAVHSALMASYVRLGRLDDAEAVYVQWGDYLDRWHQAADQGAAPHPDMFEWIQLALNQDTPLPSTVIVDPREHRIEGLARDTYEDWGSYLEHERHPPITTLVAQLVDSFYRHRSLSQPGRI